MAKTRSNDEIKEVSVEGAATVMSSDPAFHVAEGAEKVRKKQVADNLYERIKIVYPRLKHVIVPDRMLSPALIFDMTNAVRTNAELANWPNLFKLATYREVAIVES